jgi:hypothetical protein
MADLQAKPDTKNPETPALAPKVTLDENAVEALRDRAPDPDTALDYSIQR